MTRWYAQLPPGLALTHLPVERITYPSRDEVPTCLVRVLTPDGQRPAPGLPPVRVQARLLVRG